MKKTLQVLRFMVGFGDMHSTEKITWEHDSIGPAPIGYRESHVVFFLAAWALTLVIGHYQFTGDFAEIRCLMMIGLAPGLMAAMLGPVIMTSISWWTYRLRTEQSVAHRPITIHDQIADLRLRALSKDSSS